MNDLHEIVDLATVDKLLMALAVLGPLVGLAVGAGTAGADRKPGAIRGLAVGLVGTLVFAMWKVYNGITDHLGLDTVKNVVVNLVLFVAVGVVAGLLLRRMGFGAAVVSAADARHEDPAPGENP
jgi:hypothetical protein